MRWLIALLISAAPAAAIECKTVSYESNDYTICRAETDAEDIRLFLNDAETDKPLGSFRNVDTQLSEEGARLIFAMNAGMYHSDRRPVGHYVENGTEEMRLITNPGPGNFGLLPNGVFCVGEGEARVVETLRFEQEQPECRFATQSGPMLVIDGKLHPKFREGSDSTFVRNGVGTSADGKTVWFVISEQAVNFHSFASFFRDYLGTPQALYFDGNISRLYAPELGRNDVGFPMGPIVGVVAPADD